tara:strand:+ start:1205 stop:1306 length:102 start_codon:yes stop_codon:yes gene_type:complete
MNPPAVKTTFEVKEEFQQVPGVGPSIEMVALEG